MTLVAGVMRARAPKGCQPLELEGMSPVPVALRPEPASAVVEPASVFAVTPASLPPIAPASPEFLAPELIVPPASGWPAAWLAAEPALQAAAAARMAKQSERMRREDKSPVASV